MRCETSGERGYRPDMMAAVRHPDKVGCRPDIMAAVRYPEKVGYRPDIMAAMRYSDKVGCRPDRRYRSTHKKTKKEKKRKQLVVILKPDWDINGDKTHSIRFKGKLIFRLLSNGTKDIKKNIKIA